MRLRIQRPVLVAWLTGLLLPIACGTLLWLLLPRQYPQLFEYDEGYNAMKALLHARGFAFFRDIWSDQPPLLYFLLGRWFSQWGAALVNGRLFTLLFSVVLLTGFYHLVRLDHGRLTAGLAVVFLFTSWLYVQLSLSLMEIVPALAFATLALLCAAFQARRPHWGFLLGAAVFSVLAFYSRLVLGLIPALFVVRWTLAARRPAETRPLSLDRTLGLFAVFLLLGLLAGAYLLRPLDWRQLLGAHAAAYGNEGLATFAGWRVVPGFLLKDYHLVLLALGGLYFAWRNRSAGELFAAIWLGLTLAFMLTFKPVWWHYYILLALPLSWLAARGVVGFLAGHYGVGAEELFSGTARQRPLLIGFCVLIAGLLLPSRLVQSYDFLRQPGFDMNQMLLASIRSFAAQTRWLVADDAFQAYPFHFGIPVPPELAMTSPKRILHGDLTEGDWFAALKKYKPEQAVFFPTFPFPPEMTVYLNEHYYSLNPSPGTLHCVRKDLATAAWIARRQEQLVLMANFIAFLRSEPDNDRAQWQLGVELGKLGAAAESCDWFRRAIRRNPGFVEAHNSLAWILATHPDPAVRQADEAILHAEAACGLTHRRNPILLDTLAAAYASAGRFPEAVATAEKARAIAEQAGAAPIVQVIDKHLELYRNNQPYREELFAPPAEVAAHPEDTR